MVDNGTGMTPPPNGEASGALTSREVTRKNPSQGKFRSGFSGEKPKTKIDINRHGIRRETNIQPKKVGRKKI